MAQPLGTLPLLGVLFWSCFPCFSSGFLLLGTHRHQMAQVLGFLPLVWETQMGT